MKTNFRFSIWMAIMMIASTVGVRAQNTFFPTKAGMVLVYAQNEKGKTKGYSQLTIKNVEGSGNNMTITYGVQILDKDKKAPNPPFEAQCKVIVQNGVTILDMSQMFSGMQKDQTIKMEITGMPMELPGDMQPGQSLKDANMTMSIDLGFTKMNTTMTMTNGKCLAIEDVTVPGGTFKCYKITQTVSTTIMGKTVVSTTLSWYAPGIGTVKSETYNSKDQLQSSQELVEMK